MERADEICCVVSDETIPRMNGWEILAFLRKLSPGILVILMQRLRRNQGAGRRSSRKAASLPAQALSEGGTEDSAGESDERLSRGRSNGQNVDENCENAPTSIYFVIFMS
jgi:hypothetical protein